jgi:DNA gyrase subunit A
MKEFRLDQRQADAILEIRLYQLAQLEIAKIREEQGEKEKRLKEILRLLKSPKARWALIRDELAQVAETYGDGRRTAVGGGEELEYDPEAYIVHEETVVVLSRDGWIRRVREVKDPSSMRLREGDAVQQLLPGSTRDRIAFFASQGSMYVMRVADVPATTGYGEPVQSLLRLKDGERVTMACLLGDEASGSQARLPGFDAGAGAGILVATARGYGFRATPDLGETTRSGRKYARVAAGDAVVSVVPATGSEVVLATARGRMLRFALADVSDLSGPGRGVILLRPDADDAVVGALTAEPGGAFTVVTPEGTERRVRVDDVPRGRRAGKGQRVVKRGGIAAIAGREG